MEHETRALSKVLFGALYRLEVMAAIDAGDLFTLTQIAQRLGTPPSLSSVQKELKILEAAALLGQQPRVGGMREVYYVAENSPIWDMARALVSKSAYPEPLQATSSTTNGEQR